MSDHVVMAFGRMNPPTIGHQKLVDVVKAEADRVGGTAQVHLSKSHDPKKNPMPYEHKLKYAQAAFGDVVTHSDAKNPLEMLKTMHGKAKQVTVVAGSDRVKGFTELLNKYNGHPDHYTFHRIRVISAGDRDPDSDGAEGMSASKMREHAKNNDTESFKQGLPYNIRHHAGEMMNTLRTHMGVKESTVISMFKRLFLEKEHDKCGTPECCGQCETADSPTTREWGKITLVNKYKEDTPGETPMKRFKNFKEELDEEETTEPKWKKQMRDQKARYAAGERPDTKAQDKAREKNTKLRLRKYKPEMNQEETDAYGKKDGLKGSCWKNYVAIGTKKKNGKTVPNCVPKK